MRALTFALTLLANVNPSCPQRDRQQGDKDQNLDALPERQSRDGCDAGAVQISGQEYYSPGDHRDHDRPKRYADGDCRRQHDDK